MAERSRAARRAARLELDPQLTAALRGRLPSLAERTVAAITAEVPGYSGALTGHMGQTIENAVELALGTFLNLIERSRDADPSTPLAPALAGAHSLGGGEARSGRSLDALLAAYRVGARVSWREMSTIAVDSGIAARTLADFAELTFAYIDELSAASAAGHADELATAGRARQRYLERLAAQLIAGEAEDVLRAAVERADWPLPQTLTAVLVPRTQVRALLALLDEHTLEGGEDGGDGPAGVVLPDQTSVLLVPDMHGGMRAHLARLLRGRQAVLGPARTWSRASYSYQRAARALSLGLGGPGDDGPVDTEQHLAELILSMDPEGLADLRAQALQPLDALRPATAHRLAETLRSWLLHQGRRDDIAAELFVHPQTVRYRMGQLRELYGTRLEEPETILRLTLALAERRPAPSADGSQP